VDLELPEPRFDPAKVRLKKVRRRDVLEGPIHEYERAAA
jgi:hypothetical protein